MIEKLKTENEDFAEQWESTRKRGALNYILRQIRYLGSIAVGIYIVNLIIDRDMDYLLEAIISILVLVGMSCSAWFIGEWRYKMSTKPSSMP